MHGIVFRITGTKDMNAIPQPKTHQIVDRINALQAASPRFIDPSEISPLSREWRAIRHDIGQLMQADACAAWELMGSWRALAGDVDGAEAAFRNSVALGQTDVNRENWMITRLNLGLFSQAQEIYREIGTPRAQDLAFIARYGFLAGAVGQTTRLIEQARTRGFEWDEAWVLQVKEALSIMSEAEVTDAEIARRLDCAGEVLRRHGWRPVVAPRVLSVEGVFRGLTYRFAIPVSLAQAYEMDRESMLKENELALFNPASLLIEIDGVCA